MEIRLSEFRQKSVGSTIFHRTSLQDACVGFQGAGQEKGLFSSYVNLSLSGIFTAVITNAIKDHVKKNLAKTTKKPGKNEVSEIDLAIP